MNFVRVNMLKSIYCIINFLPTQREGRRRNGPSAVTKVHKLRAISLKVALGVLYMLFLPFVEF